MTSLESTLTHEEQFRNLLLDALERELVGPDLPPNGFTLKEGQSYDEILEESPTQRYSAGVLFPQSQPLNEIENADDAIGDESNEAPEKILAEEQSAQAYGSGSSSDSMADAYDETVRLANEFLPSAIGMSCLCKIPDDGVIIRTRAARYESQKPTDPSSKRTQEWRRIELQLPEHRLLIPSGSDRGMDSFPFEEHLQLRAIYRHLADGIYLVTFSLINTKVGNPDSRVKAAECFFQVGISAEATEGRQLFHEYKVLGRIGICVASWH